MANREVYITPAELRSIANVLDAMDSLYKTIKESNVSVALLEDPEGYGTTTSVADSNGDILGHIGYGDSGFVLYCDDGSGD